SEPVWAVAGIQFVMRLPHHACDKISGSPIRGAGTKADLHSRAQRFGEMEHWASWAHGLGARGPCQADDLALAPEVERLQRLLGMAGLALKKEASELPVRRLPLEGEPPTGPAEGVAFPLSEGTLAEAFDALAQAEPAPPAILIF